MKGDNKLYEHSQHTINTSYRLKSNIKSLACYPHNFHFCVLILLICGWWYDLEMDNPI